MFFVGWCSYIFFFFFSSRRRHTRYIGDWSSDVCSSDLERAEQARYDQALQDLTGQLHKAQASLDGARKVAENTPLELDAARTTEIQERARYQAGLATLVDVADAQSFLVQVEIDDSLARLAVWQNLASVAAAQGDLGPFLQSLHEATQ